MVDVDGVLVDGRPEDGLHWQTSLEADLGFTSEALDKAFFAPHWESIVVGRAALMDHLPAALQRLAPHVAPASFVSYWFQRDARLVEPLLQELRCIRSAGIGVYLATNQEHMRAAWLMDQLGLARDVDGIFYSARLGARKPDPHFFTAAQTAVGLAGAEILLLDDSLRNVEAARAAGWQALHWTKQHAPSIVRELCTGQQPGPS